MQTSVVSHFQLVFRYRRILSRFSPHIRSPEKSAELPTLPHNIPIIGFSATFSRHDGLALGSVFERIVYHQDFLQMIKDQWCVAALKVFTEQMVTASTGLARWFA